MNDVRFKEVDDRVLNQINQENYNSIYDNDDNMFQDDEEYEGNSTDCMVL